MFLVPSLRTLCILRLAAHADQLEGIECPSIPFTAYDEEVDLHVWIVLIHLFTDLPRRLCSFSTSEPHRYSHGFLSVLCLPRHASLTPDVLRSAPNLTALDASHSRLPRLPPLPRLRILYLRNCTRLSLDFLHRLSHLPLLSVIDLSGTKSSPLDPLCPFSPSAEHALFQPDIHAALDALAALYPHAFPSPLYTLTYVPSPTPLPVPRKGSQDSFVVFSSSSTKMGNTNSLVYQEEHPHNPIPRTPPLPRSALPRPAFYASLPSPSPSPLHLHRPPPPLPSPNQPPTLPPKPRSSLPAPASLNLQNHKAQLARKGFDAFINLRSTPSTPSLDPPSSSLPPSTSRNPFRKPTAPLKPISSFPPPILPKDIIPRKKPKFIPKPKPTSSHTSFDWKSWGSA